ncbi:hypothetical protein RFX30_10760, partial [Acinetobacter baumannii]|nr:hypothetical protein [Acinetobacter baumannii]
MSVDIKSVGFIQAKHSSNFIVVLDCKVLNNEDLMKYGVDGMDTINQLKPLLLIKRKSFCNCTEATSRNPLRSDRSG